MIEKSLANIVDSLRASNISARELALEAMANNRCGAYHHVDKEVTLAQADAADKTLRDGAVGPLHGIPASVKDLYGVTGFPTFAGSGKALPAKFQKDGRLLRRFRSQHGVVTGKTHTVEFAFGGIGTNPRYTTPRNPWSKDGRAPGGSSAGAGVSLCEGSALVAFGTDTAGSVRIPASWTGNVGLKTTAGRWSTEGIVPLSSTLDTAGILTRTVADLKIAFGALDTDWPTPLLSGMRFGIASDVFWEDCSAGVVGAVQTALQELNKAGVKSVPFAFTEASPAVELLKLGGPVSAELYDFLKRELPSWFDDLEPNVRARVGDAGNLPAHVYLNRLALMRRYAASVDERMRDVDVVVTPTVANTPPLLSALKDTETYKRENILCLRNTSVVSYVGLCAITIPVGLDALGMPVGMSLIGRRNSEPELIAIAHAVEGVLGTSRERLGEVPFLSRPSPDGVA